MAGFQHSGSGSRRDPDRISMVGLNLTPLSPEPAPVPVAVGDVSVAPEGVEYEPVLLTQLQDDLARSRLREAVWISLIFHMALVIAAATSPKWLPKPAPVLVSAADLLKNQELTYMQLPSDQQKVAKPKNSNIISDKDRSAMSRRPTIDNKALQELRASRLAQQAPPQPPQQAMQQAAPQQNEGPQGGQQQMAQNTNPNALQLQQLQRQQPKPNPFAMQGTAGTAIQQAARAGSRGLDSGGGVPGFGAGVGGSKVFGNAEILSDTMGVDFGPYMNRVINDVRMNWYSLIPESAMPPFLKKGNVMIEFVILPDGSISGMQIVPGYNSGDVSLDRAAWGGITKSNPFMPLPKEFKGPYLRLRFRFYYNPDKGEIQ